MVAQSLLHHLDMRFIITFTLLLFYICCTKGDDKKLKLKNYISNVNENTRNFEHSQPLNETIYNESSLKENLLSDMNANDIQNLNKPANGKNVNIYLRTFTNAVSRHKSTLNKNQLTYGKKLSQRKMKKKKAIRRISRKDTSNELRVSLEDTSSNKYLPLFDVGNDKPNLNDHSTPHFNDDTNYQPNQNNSELNLKKYITPYSLNGDGGHQLYQYNSKLSLNKYPMSYSDVDDDSLNNELNSYGNGDDNLLIMHMRSKPDLYQYLMSKIKSKNKKHKQRKVKKKKISKKVSRVKSNKVLLDPFEKASRKNKLDLSRIATKQSNDYSISYANDDINYQLNQNGSELDLKKFLASFSANTEGDHLLYQHNSKLSLQKHSILSPYADEHSLNLILYGNGDNYHPLNTDIRSKPRHYKYLTSKTRNKYKQRRVKKKKLHRKIFRDKSSDELSKPLEDTTTKRETYLSKIKNSEPSLNYSSTSYVSDNINYQLNPNKSELNLNKNVVLYSVNGDGDYQSLQYNSIPSLDKYTYPNEYEKSVKKDSLFYENGDSYNPLSLHTRNSKPRFRQYLMPRVNAKNNRKLKQRKMKKRKSIKKIYREESSDELREPLEEKNKEKYLRLSTNEKNKTSSNNSSVSHEKGDINYEINQNKSDLSIKNDSIPYPNKNDENNEENDQAIDHYIRSHPKRKKSHWKSHNAKRFKALKLKNKSHSKTRQKIFRVDNRHEQPFKDLTRKRYLRFFKIRNSRPRPKKYMNMVIASDHRQNYVGKFHRPTHYDESSEDHIIPDLKKSLQLIKNAANLFQESESSMNDYNHHHEHDRNLNLNLFLLNQVKDKDIPQYKTFSDVSTNDESMVNDHQMALKYHLLPRKNKERQNQHYKVALKVDNLSYDKDRPIFNINLSRF